MVAEGLRVMRPSKSRDSVSKHRRSGGAGRVWKSVRTSTRAGRDPIIFAHGLVRWTGSVTVECSHRRVPWGPSGACAAAGGGGTSVGHDSQIRWQMGSLARRPHLNCEWPSWNPCEVVHLSRGTPVSSCAPAQLHPSNSTEVRCH